MKSIVGRCLLGSILIFGAVAQNSQKPVLTPGVSVQMADASHATEMREADEPTARVVAISADGRVFLGIKPTEPAALGDVRESTVYVKADSRAPYQKVLAVLDALRGKSVVLLTAPPQSAVRQTMMPPYGIQLMVGR